MDTEETGVLTFRDLAYFVGILLKGKAEERLKVWLFLLM
jgi:hypothetical protein